MTKNNVDDLRTFCKTASLPIVKEGGDHGTNLCWWEKYEFPEENYVIFNCYSKHGFELTDVCLVGNCIKASTLEFDTRTYKLKRITRRLPDGTYHWENISVDDNYDAWATADLFYDCTGEEEEYCKIIERIYDYMSRKLKSLSLD